MRRTLRLLAGVKSVRYLEAGNPTGITGLFTHPSPRSTLLFLYSSTLDKIKAIPEHSLYRQSVEAVTKHRLGLVESVTPPGYEEWATKARERISKHPEQFRILADGALDGSRAARVERDGKQFVIRDLPRIKDERYQEWDGEVNEGPELEGSRSGDERKEQEVIAKRAPLEESEKVHWDPEPQLTADQISELETKIGAGLIEEVVQVAEKELDLIDTMSKAKVWESLDEQPGEGQWKYFERKS